MTKELHVAQELKTVLQETVGRALDSEAAGELPDNVDWRSTG